MDKKKCSHCGREKKLSDFYCQRTENRYSSWCRECIYTKQKQRWRDRKRKVVELFGGKCSICGYKKNFGALDFHHLDPSKKEYGWGKLKEKSWNKIIVELQKCILVCRNCHAEIHWPEWSNVDEYASGCSDNNYLNGVIKKNGEFRNFLEPTGKCPACDKGVYGTKYCSVKCSTFMNRKVARPKRKTLIKLLDTESWCAIGRKYGVSDNAVRKWARAYQII
tara:strand:+ start:1127 stop:1789 length:663 start_codon:yes stop_codon:yes gene_type:complete